MRRVNEPSTPSAAYAGLSARAACASPSKKIATELTRDGLDASQVSCVGDRLESKLAISQVQELARSARAMNDGDATPGRLTGSDLIRVASRIKDPQVPVEVAKAAAGCNVVGGINPTGAKR